MSWTHTHTHARKKKKVACAPKLTYMRCGPVKAFLHASIMNKAVSRREGKRGRESQNKRVGRRGRGDVSGFPPSQMAEEERKRPTCYTLRIVSPVCRSVAPSLLLYELGHSTAPAGEQSSTRFERWRKQATGEWERGEQGKRGKLLSLQRMGEKMGGGR